MVMSRLAYSRPRSYSRPFGEVAPIIDATNPLDAIRQIFEFMARHQSYRVGIPDTSFFPFSAICRLNLTFPSGSYHGTGFYIGNGLILSCGHNLFDKTPDGSGTEAATAVTVRVGQQNATTWLDTFDVKPADWTVHPDWVSSGATDRGFDLSVIRVTHAPPGGNYFRMINYCPSPETPIAVCGYGSDTDVDSQRQHLDIDKVREIVNNGENVDYNLQTRGGNSGSPVFAHFTNTASEMPDSIPVMGIHVSTASDELNRAVLLTPDKIDWALGGGISSVSAFSLSNGRSALGGLPLVRRNPAMLGGLPLSRGNMQPILRTPTYARPLDRNWIVIDQSASGGMSVAKRTFGHPTRDASGKTTLTVRVPNMPSGGSVLWNIPDATHKAIASLESGGNATTFVRGTTATLRSLSGGSFALDCMVKDSGGKTVESNKYWLSSPQFVLVAINPTTDAFLTAIGLGGRRAAILAEMKATMEHIYRSVNMRFIFPGDALPAPLGVGANAAFPAGIEAQTSVIYAEMLGDETIMDPEESQDVGAPTAYADGVLGRNHQPGDMPAPMAGHTLARGLVHRFAPLFPDINALQARTTAGTLAAAEMGNAATFYGRLMGENLSHEVAHFAISAFQVHTPSGLTEDGTGRTTLERTGMTIDTATGAITDTGRAAINDLPADVLRAFEEHLPIDPPIDQAGVTARGRVGSFSRTRGWVNRSMARPLSEGEITVHLPGTTVLDGWKADAFVFAIETAFRTTLAGNPAFVLFTPFVNVDLILEACDRLGVTLAVGLSGGGGLGIGGGTGTGIVFAPSHRIGFYGSGNGIVGHIYGATVSMQITLIDGGPEKLSGDAYMAGISVATLGWFDAGTIDAPVGVHAIFDMARNPIGITFEFGLGVGLPVISLIEAYGQRTRTVTTLGRRRFGHSLSAPRSALEDAIANAVAGGAPPGDARNFLSVVFA